MITEGEVAALQGNSAANGGVSYQMSDADLASFKKNSRLPGMIAERKIQNDIDKGIKAIHGYSDIEDRCLISVTSLKKTINGSQRPTRSFLYKFAVGLKMTREEADQFFELCGGRLRDDCLEDKICINALRDGDDIHQFVYDMERYTRFEPRKK